MSAEARTEPTEPAEAPTAEERELAAGQPRPKPDETPQDTAPEPARTVVPRWVQLALLPIVPLALWVAIKLAGKVLLVFLVATLIALLLNPVVAFVQRAPHVRRGFAVLVVYLTFFIAVIGIGFLLANPISNQVNTFTKDLPHIVDQANKTLASFQKTLNKHGIHVQIIKQGHTALQTLQEKVEKAAGSLVSFGGDILTKVVSTAFDLILIFVLSIYMLSYGPKIGELVRHIVPPGDGTPADDYPTLAQQAVSSYVRGQLLFSAIMGVTAGVALYVFGVLGIFPDGETYAVAFGAFLAVAELIPYVGPILGALPPVLVALFTDPITAVWVALLFLGLQQFEGHVVAPQIFGHSLRINPLLVIAALLIGLQIDGIVGAVVALPTLAIARETVLYLHRHLTFEPWDRRAGPLL